MPSSATPSSPSGPAEAVQALRAEGYGESIEVSENGIWCKGCQRFHAVDGVVQERIYRFEGASNPDDMSIVVGLRCRTCGRSGIVVSAYGPAADPKLFDVLMQMPIGPGAADPSP